MKGIVIDQDQGIYLVSGDDGKRYKFSLLDWLGKASPKIGDTVDFVCNDDVISSVFPLLKSKQSGHSKVVLLFVCFLLGALGVHRFMVGKVGTGILMLILSLSVIGGIVSIIWAIIDFILIAIGEFSDKSGNKIAN
ncbi:TM2 domain-containing protein [Bartonella sp. B17]